jgi:hypothetical protein
MRKKAKIAYFKPLFGICPEELRKTTTKHSGKVGGLLTEKLPGKYVM